MRTKNFNKTNKNKKKRSRIKEKKTMYKMKSSQHYFVPILVKTIFYIIKNCFLFHKYKSTHIYLKGRKELKHKYQQIESSLQKQQLEWERNNGD